MRVLFIVQNIENAEPIGLMLLAALLKRRSHHVRLAGARTTPLNALMASFQPDLVGFSLCTGQHPRLLSLNRALKKRFSYLSVFGGPHATFFPEVIEEDGVDVVCRGEGEGAMLDLVHAAESGESYDSIPNLWVRRADGVSKNPLRPLIENVDALPFPDREVRYESDPLSRHYPIKSFLASRGCPFACSYCFNVGFLDLYGEGWSKPRVRSVGNVLDEIRLVRSSSALEFVQFRESVFPWQLSWLSEFAERYPREVGLPFYCHVRADLLTEQRVSFLAKAGCVSVNLGIECGDERYRRERLGRSMTDEQIREGCRMLKARGIRILADNMLGLPGAGPEVDWKTLRLNQQCKVDYPLAMLFQPYPGTKLGTEAVEQGLFDGCHDRIFDNYYWRSPLRYPSRKARNSVENMQKLFALMVEAPTLEALIRPLLPLEPNLIFLSVFRAWYTTCYVSRIVPHRIGLGELKELLLNLFGFYTPEANRELIETNQGVDDTECSGGARDRGGTVSDRLQRARLRLRAWRSGKTTVAHDSPA